MRTLLTAPTSFYCNTETGSLTYDGQSLEWPLPQPQDVLNRLQQQYDLGGQPVDIWCADGQRFGAVYLSGPLVGQTGASGLTLHGGSTLGASMIVPAGNGPNVEGQYAVGLAFGAQLTITNCWMDNTVQLANGSNGEDVVNIGQGSRLVMLGDNKLVQDVIGGKNAYNFISAEIGSSLSIVPLNGAANLRFAGAAEFGIDPTTGSYVAAECNTLHGIVSFWADDTPTHPTGPYFYGAFADAAGGFINLAGVDFKNPSYGYRYYVRWGGTLFVNEAGDPGQLGRLFGNAGTNWPVAGYIA